MKLTAHSSRKAPDLSKVVSKDESRPVLCSVYLDVDRQVIEATDSYRLASVPVEVEEGDVSGLIPIEAVTKLVKLSQGRRSGNPASLLCRENDVVLVDDFEGTRQEWKRPEGVFPTVPNLIPSEDTLHKFRVGLNAKMLADLCAGLGSDENTIELRFVQGAGNDPNPLRPMVVRSLHNREAVGLLMPIRIAS